MKAFVYAALVFVVLANSDIKKLQAQTENHEYCDRFASALTVKQSEAAEFCSLYPYEVCSAAESICVHKKVFPVLSSEIVGLVILTITIGFTSVSGLGGGLVFVPIMMAFFHFKTKQVVAMSLAIVFQSGFIRTFGFSFWASHPDKKDSTEIDWNTVKVAYPLFLVGSYLGVLTSMVLPDILLCVLLTIILVYLCYTSFVKGRLLWQNESRALLDRVEQPFSD